VAVNGVIGAMTRSYAQDGKVSFLAMVPPDLFREGENRIDLIQVMPDGELRLISEP
jgi:hypothetical protein